MPCYAAKAAIPLTTIYEAFVMQGRILAHMQAFARQSISPAPDMPVNDFDKMQQIPDAYRPSLSGRRVAPLLLPIAAACETRDFDDAGFAPGDYHG
jgi:hypothetical protein